MPYLVWDTVFDNSRVVAEMGRAPEPFSKYCYPLLRFSAGAPFHVSLSGLAGAPAQRVAEEAGGGRRGGPRAEGPHA